MNIMVKFGMWAPQKVSVSPNVSPHSTKFLKGKIKVWADLPRSSDHNYVKLITKGYFKDMVDLYSYSDYRAFLADWIEEQRDARPWLSWRYLGNRIDMDPSTLVKVFQGQRHVSLAKIQSFCEALKLDSQESKFFSCLVRLGRSTDADERSQLQEQLLRLKELRLVKVKGGQLRFYEEWHHTAIRALISARPCFADYKVLANSLNPSITAQEAQDSVELLLELGLLNKLKDGTLEATDDFVTCGGGASAESVRQYQRQTILLGERSLLEDPPDLRDISSLTLSIPKSLHPEVRVRLAEFRKSILALVKEQDDADSVYQLNLQWIPLSRG